LIAAETVDVLESYYHVAPHQVAEAIRSLLAVSGIWAGIVSNALLGGIRLDSCDDSRPDDSMRLSAPRLLVAPTRRSALRSR
jgi:hypothetical protein